MITDPGIIRAMQLRAQIATVKLEGRGFRRHGQSLTARLKGFYGLPKNASRADLLASLQDDLKAQDELIMQVTEEGAHA